MHRFQRAGLGLLPMALGCISCSHGDSSDTTRLLEPQAQAANGLVTVTAPPSDLYPIISPLVGGNSYAIAHPNDYDISRDPNEVPSKPLANNATVNFNVLEINSVIAPADPTTNPPVWSGATDVRANFLAFGATTDDPSVPKGFWSPRVPAPFLKVVAGNTVNIVLTNSPSNTNTHSIDFHAVVGLKGGSAMLTAAPGATATLAITPTHPGLYLYHCSEAGTPRGIAEHMNMGMYGMVLVLSPYYSAFNDALYGASEHYVFEEDVFLTSTGDFDEVKALNTLTPDFVTYNGRVASLIDHPLSGSAAGNYVIYHGAGGMHIPSFHIIGAIFDNTWDLGDTTSRPLRGLQTVAIPSAGVAVMEIDSSNLIVNSNSNGVVGTQLDILVDHASPFFRKGALGLMLVTGD